VEDWRRPPITESHCSRGAQLGGMFTPGNAEQKQNKKCTGAPPEEEKKTESVCTAGLEAVGVIYRRALVQISCALLAASAYCSTCSLRRYGLH
jgi:hypothetical protein